MKIDGKNYQVSKSAQEILLSELNSDKKEKMQKFFSIFDKEGGKADGKLSQAEIQEALETLQKWEQGKKADGELTNKEIKMAMKRYPELKGLSKKEAREFIKTFLSVNEQKVLVEETKAEQEAEEARKAEEAAKAAEAKAAEETKAEQPKTYDYVVPEGQSFKALMKKILLAQGKKEDELTDEDYAKAEEQFRADNPDTKIRGNKVKYLLAGERVKVSVDFGEELLDSKAEEAKWAKRVEARRQIREKARAEKENAPDPKVVKEAEKKGMRATYNKNFFYNEAEKMHYRYKDGKFIKYPNIKLIRKDGTYVREYKNADGSSKVYDYSKDGYPTSAQGRNYQGKAYLNEKKQAQVLGFKDTFATNNEHIYYDPKTKMHFKWNDEKKRFDAMNKDARYVSPDGDWSSTTPHKIITVRDKKTGKVKTRTERQFGSSEYTYDANGNYIKFKNPNGSTEGYERDANGNIIKETYKDSAGKVIGSKEYKYDSNGNKIEETSKDATGKVIGSKEYKYDSNGNKIKETYKDGAGKVTGSEEYDYDTNNHWTKTTCKDKGGNITQTYEYTLDSNGERTKVIIKDKDGNTLGSRELVNNEWVYKDGTGKVITEEEYNKI